MTDSKYITVTVKPLEEKCLCLRLEKEFLDMIPKAQSIRDKMINWAL
jgi:hypothetical protein